MFVIYWEQFNVQSVMFIFVCLQDLFTSLDVNLASFNFRRTFVTILHVYRNVSFCFNQNTVIIIMFCDDDDDDGSMRYFGNALCLSFHEVKITLLPHINNGRSTKKFAFMREA